MVSDPLSEFPSEWLKEILKIESPTFDFKTQYSSPIVPPLDNDLSIVLWNIRCIGCGKVIGNLQLTFEKKLKEGLPVNQALDEIGLRKSCCRSEALAPPTFFMHNDNIERAIIDNNLIRNPGESTSRVQRISQESLNNLKPQAQTFRF